MASDLPDFGYTGPVSMARKLVTYIDDPKRVWRAVKEEFGAGPSVAEIEIFRTKFLYQREQALREPAFKPHDGYYPSDASDRAETANQRFVAALRRSYPERFPAAPIGFEVRA